MTPAASLVHARTSRTETAPGWFAAYTRSKFEKSVAADLTEQQIETYLPLVREAHRWKDRIKTVEVPLFPGYVLVRCASDAEELRILRTLGVVRVLSTGGRRAVIPEMEVDAIRRLLSSNLPFQPWPFLQEGDMVRVKRGPLRDVEGRLVRMKGGFRLVLSVEMLSRAVAAEIDAHDVEAARPWSRAVT